jgi:hypothetical protein
MMVGGGAGSEQRPPPFFYVSVGGGRSAVAVTAVTGSLMAPMAAISHANPVLESEPTRSLKSLKGYVERDFGGSLRAALDKWCFIWTPPPSPPQSVRCPKPSSKLSK